jgi:hypothetical protein
MQQHLASHPRPLLISGYDEGNQSQRACTHVRTGTHTRTHTHTHTYTNTTQHTNTTQTRTTQLTQTHTHDTHAHNKIHMHTHTHTHIPPVLQPSNGPQQPRAQDPSAIALSTPMRALNAAPPPPAQRGPANKQGASKAMVVVHAPVDTDQCAVRNDSNLQASVQVS